MSDNQNESEATPQEPSLDGKTYTQEEVDALIEQNRVDASQKANKEAASLRRRLKEAEAATAENEDNGAPESAPQSEPTAENDVAKVLAALEGVKQENQRFQEQLVESHLAAALQNEAAKRNLASQEAAIKLLNRENITFDSEKFQAVGVSEAFDALEEAYPFLKSKTPPNTPLGNTGRVAPPTKKLTDKEIFEQEYLKRLPN